MDSFDIIIAGGGMVGQSFALSMADQDLKIAIVEPNNSNPTLNDQFHTRVSAITPKSENLLEKLGAWNLIKRKYAFTDTKVWDQNS
ncbi:MAG: 2-octaprenyl-3-methyl-6-methoxy-1,4-benzoquinol hydroxylase, partial [Candidatus Thioglobus sp.]|nr:2-octaprenyl-3-methyl-6-methoxy-1,4-benzoquinol hydroxylase [Candidatus Thioglobus sp.]MBT6655461.1 2-octaprenyl-3-methyl-6-methoxy-1,4-benzoquinol hydroxylase [Candidatus Thioglobus sp.]